MALHMHFVHTRDIARICPVKPKLYSAAQLVYYLNICCVSEHAYIV